MNDRVSLRAAMLVVVLTGLTQGCARESGLAPVSELEAPPPLDSPILVDPTTTRSTVGEGATAAQAVSGISGSQGTSQSPENRAAPKESANPPAFVGNPSVMTLVSSADDHEREGRYSDAAVGYERALEMEPGNPWLWHRLAKIRLQEKKPEQAISLAEKSNSLEADRDLTGHNWALIAEAHTQLGQENPAQAATEQAKSFGYSN